MGFFKVLKRRKILFLNIFLLLYILINLFMGERGLISYFEKENLLKDLNEEQVFLTQKVKTIENDTNRDNFMSAERALEYGLIDQIVSSR